MLVFILSCVFRLSSSEVAKHSLSRCGLCVAHLFACWCSWLLLTQTFGEKDVAKDKVAVVWGSPCVPPKWMLLSRPFGFLVWLHMTVMSMKHLLCSLKTNNSNTFHKLRHVCVHACCCSHLFWGSYSSRCSTSTQTVWACFFKSEAGLVFPVVCFYCFGDIMVHAHLETCLFSSVFE